MLLDGQIGSNNYNRLKPMFPRWRGNRGRSSGPLVYRSRENMQTVPGISRAIPAALRNASAPPFSRPLMQIYLRFRSAVIIHPVAASFFSLSLLFLSFSLFFFSLEAEMHAKLYLLQTCNVDLIYGHGMMLFLRSREILSRCYFARHSFPD